MVLSLIEKLFHQFALIEDPEELKKVLNSKDQDAKQKTPLHKASERGNLEMVKALILLGAEIETKNEFEFTPLHLACYYSYTDVAKYLIDMGAQIHLVLRLRVFCFLRKTA